MAEARLQAGLVQSKAEIVRLRERMSVGMPTVHKDLSLISLVPKWSDSETAIPLEEFLASTEGAAKIGRWESPDQLQIAVFRLVDPAKSFYNACLELHVEDTTWQKFKEVFRERFKDLYTNQYHFTKLQMVRQAKKERAQEFADRCRELAQKIMCKSQLYNSPAYSLREHMLLPSFVTELTGFLADSRVC